MENIFDLIILAALLVLLLIQEGVSVCIDPISASASATLEGTTSCYYGMNGAYYYPDAKTLCESGGTHLLFLETTEERLEIKNSFPQYSHIWLGVEKMGVVWKWVDGTEHRDANPKFVVDADDGNFAKTYDLWNSDLWDDVVSTMVLGAICEKEFVENFNTTSYDTTTPGAMSSTDTAISTTAAEPSTRQTMSVTLGTAAEDKHGITKQVFRKRSVSRDTCVVISNSKSASTMDCARKCLASTSCIGFKYYMTGRFCERLADAAPTGKGDGCGSSSQFVCYDKI